MGDGVPSRGLAVIGDVPPVVVIDEEGGVASGVIGRWNRAGGVVFAKLDDLFHRLGVFEAAGRGGDAIGFDKTLVIEFRAEKRLAIAVSADETSAGAECPE